MAAQRERPSFEGERPPEEREATTWKPGAVKHEISEQSEADECLLKNNPCVLDGDSEGSEFSDISVYEDDTDLRMSTEMEDLCSKISSMPEDITFPQQQAASTYEVEDWDKELEEAECNPYERGFLDAFGNNSYLDLFHKDCASGTMGFSTNIRLWSPSRRGHHEVEKRTNKLLLEFADAAGNAKGASRCCCLLI